MTANRTLAGIPFAPLATPTLARALLGLVVGQLFLGRFWCFVLPFATVPFRGFSVRQCFIVLDPTQSALRFGSPRHFFDRKSKNRIFE